MGSASMGLIDSGPRWCVANSSRAQLHEGCAQWQNDNMTDEQKPASNDEKIRAEVNRKISDEEFERVMKSARKVMRKNRDILRKLADTNYE